jgi:hypothetical protein
VIRLGLTGVVKSRFAIAIMVTQAGCRRSASGGEFSNRGFGVGRPDVENLRPAKTGDFQTGLDRRKIPNADSASDNRITK